MGSRLGGRLPAPGLAAMYPRTGWGYKCLVVTCPQCGASRGDDVRFCENCGTLLGRCPSCGEPVRPGKSFCRFRACPTARAREQRLDGALDVPPVEPRARVPVVAAPGPEEA